MSLGPHGRVLDKEVRMILLRRELGDALRERRRTQGRRHDGRPAGLLPRLAGVPQLHAAGAASSELLASICHALELPLSSLMSDVARRVARSEAMTIPVSLPVAGRVEDVAASAA